MDWWDIGKWMKAPGQITVLQLLLQIYQETEIMEKLVQIVPDQLVALSESLDTREISTERMTTCLSLIRLPMNQQILALEPGYMKTLLEIRGLLKNTLQLQTTIRMDMF